MNMPVHTHGAGGYVRGCRCDVCTEANRIRSREGRASRAERLAKGEVNPTHGTYSTYINYGCRCDDCRSAASRKQSA